MKLILRGDGDDKIGLGHIYRLISILQMVRDDFDCLFVVCNPSASVLSLINSTGVPLKVINEFTDITFAQKEDILILDGYQFDYSYQLSVKEKGVKLVCIDDYQHTDYYADIVINHAPGVTKDLYQFSTVDKFLLGPDYAMIRPAFLNAKSSAGYRSGIIICMGSSDPNQLIPIFLNCILGTHKGEIHVVTGALNSLNEKLQNYEKCKLHIDLNESELAKLMSRSKIAVVSSSTILFECLAMQLICLSGFYVDNQKKIYSGFLDMNAIHGLGNLNELNKETFKEALVLANNAHSIPNVIDGNSGQRILSAIKSLQ